METVILFIEPPHMEHEHCLAVKVDKKEKIRRNSVDSHGVTGKFNGSCDDIDPHMGDEMVGHMVVTGFIGVFCVVGAHEIEKYAERSFGTKSDKVFHILPEHHETCGGAYHGSHDGKGETAGFTVEKIKSGSDKKETEKVEEISDFGSEDELNRSKHKAHTDDDRKSTFKAKLVFFHDTNNPPKFRCWTGKIFSIDILYIYNIEKGKKQPFLKK